MIEKSQEKNFKKESEGTKGSEDTRESQKNFSYNVTWNFYYLYLLHF